ncbi:mitochondrial glycoprotein [Chloropicon primus]|uniref:Mitochondrial glycoprotein n=1 Tax=Chloropicon primus TaxID=1764295 RepID=A0A5B8MCZ4_9CHLO|nr:mitochondrial glycoprotein [Chloropicon primus]UPQ97284.1 mitochondrial glycoprotein [Chloropicon primus]|mmetsp:Transcript_1061/g.3138  ORF Transcript_1061/g.3138 Transcript_1061/m.3138 type:complete len:303 (-) Transcript_1061:2037-2945(-)|eukprot:QDZ18071.1 mitochondrial glycoprotein [Chloropicon primus]
MSGQTNVKQLVKSLLSTARAFTTRSGGNSISMSRPAPASLGGSAASCRLRPVPLTGWAQSSVLPKPVGGLAGSQGRVAGLCTSVSKKTPTTLGEILSEELKTEESLYYKDELIDSVPAGFELTQTDGDSSMELSTEYKGETVAVVFSITEFRSDEGDFDNLDDYEDDEDEPAEGAGAVAPGEDDFEDDDDDNYEEEPEPSIDFNVHIGKGKETLTFECTTDGSIYTINTVNISNEDSPMERLEYEGPNFEDLEENLQEGFFEYLHERGIDYEFARYLFTVAIDKEQREYMNWLKDIQSFVSK